MTALAVRYTQFWPRANWGLPLQLGAGIQTRTRGRQLPGVAQGTQTRLKARISSAWYHLGPALTR